MADIPTEPQPSGTAVSSAISLQKHVPSLYFNGFSLGMSNSDFVARLNVEQTELMELRMSFTMAKTLAQKLTEAVDKFEKFTGHNLMTTDEVFAALKKAGIAK